MIRIHNKVFYTLILTLLLCFSFKVSAQDVSSLIDQVKRLDRQLNALERQIYQGGGSIANAGVAVSSAGTALSKPSIGINEGNISQIQTLEQELQRITGTIEDLSHQLTIQQNTLQTLKRDMEFRLSELEKKMAPAIPSQGPIPPTKGKELLKGINEESITSAEDLAHKAGEKSLDASKNIGNPISTLDDTNTVTLPSSKPEKKVTSEMLSGKETSEQYTACMDFLKEKDYTAARIACETFIQNHPDDPLAGQAHYWAGEAHFALGDYKKASVSFLKGYRDYPKNNTKRYDCLLKLGESLNKLNKPVEACATLDKLLEDLPEVNQGLKVLAQEHKSAWKC